MHSRSKSSAPGQSLGHSLVASLRHLPTLAATRMAQTVAPSKCQVSYVVAISALARCSHIVNAGVAVAAAGATSAAQS